MNIVVETVAGMIVLRVSGEIDMSNSNEIESAVAIEVPNDAHGVILDLSEVTYLDSAGIRLLYHLDVRLGMHQQRLVTVVPTGSVLTRTLQAAGVIGSLVLTATVDAAITVLRTEEKRANGQDGNAS